MINTKFIFIYIALLGELHISDLQLLLKQMHCSVMLIEYADRDVKLQLYLKFWKDSIKVLDKLKILSKRSKIKERSDYYLL